MIEKLEMFNGFMLSDSSIESKFMRELTFAGIKFEQQKPIGAYFADFYFPDFNLVVELDGRAFHSTPEQIEHDGYKNKYILKQGYKLIRITGSMVYNETDAIIPILRLFPESKQVYYINSLADVLHIQKFALGQYLKKQTFI